MTFQRSLDDTQVERFGAIPMLCLEFFQEKGWAGDLSGRDSGFPARRDWVEFLAERGCQPVGMDSFLSVLCPRHPERDFLPGDLRRSFHQVFEMAFWTHAEKDFFVCLRSRRLWIRKKQEKPLRVFYLLK